MSSKSLYKGLLATALVVPTFLVSANAAKAAAGSDTVSANATAKIVAAIAIAKIQDLDFGSLIAGSGGTATVAPGGTRTVSGITDIPVSRVAAQAAQFNVTGETGASYSITLPTTIDITLLSDNTKKMTVNAFTSNPATSSTLVAGSNQLNVGATLTVAADQAPGSYSGTFNVTVAYN